MLSGSPGPDSLSDTAAPARTFCNTISEIYIFIFSEYNSWVTTPCQCSQLWPRMFYKGYFCSTNIFAILTLYRLFKHRIQQVVSLRHNNSILTKNYTTSFLIFVTEKKYYKWLVPGKLRQFKCDDTTSVVHFLQRYLRRKRIKILKLAQM